MLVLEVKHDKGIVIETPQGKVTISLARVKRQRHADGNSQLSAVLGVDAPKEVSVWREELWKQMREQ
jgi:sRNA-binding carbon storage regulator CsrA